MVSRPPEEIRVLRSLLVELDTLLSTTILPENRSARAREILSSSLAIVDDLATHRVSAAAKLGSKGGKATVAARGPEYFRELQARRKNRAGGRPPKQD